MYADGHATLAIGMAGADDGDRKAVFTVFLHEERFAGNLVARVLPIRVGEGSALGDDVRGGGLVVGRGGTDVDILTTATLEETDIALYL